VTTEIKRLIIRAIQCIIVYQQGEYFMNTIRTLFAASAMLIAGQAHAALTITPADFLNQSQAQAQSAFNGLADDLSAGVWMNPSNSAEAHSAGFIPVGVQVALEVSTLTVDPDAPQWSLMSGATPPSALPFPALRISVGIPFGLDVGYMVLSVPDSNIEVSGFEGRIALGRFIPVPFLEANVRYHQSTLTGVTDFEIKNSGFALMVGANLPFIKPYLEVGTTTSVATPSGQLLSGPVALQKYSADKTTLAIGAKVEFMMMVLNIEQASIGDQDLFTIKLGAEF